MTLRVLGTVNISPTTQWHQEYWVQLIYHPQHNNIKSIEYSYNRSITQKHDDIKSIEYSPAAHACEEPSLNPSFTFFSFNVHWSKFSVMDQEYKSIKSYVHHL